MGLRNLSTKQQTALKNAPMKIGDILRQAMKQGGDLYHEPVKVLALAGNTASKQTFTNQDNAPFLITEIIGYAQVSATQVKTFSYTVNFKDSGRQKNLMSADIHGSALGSGDFPTKLQIPYLLPGTSTMEIAFANILAATPIDIYITFRGYKVNPATEVIF